MQTRHILHVDMDAFFAAIEVVNNQELKGKPVIIGGQPDQRGVVSTCSYEARYYGVRSAMSLFEAKKRCPHGIFLDCNFELYRTFSQKIMAIFFSFTSEVEVVSVDEAYLDITSLCTRTSPKEIGKAIRKKVLEETKLTCTVGVASNKMIAKIASSSAKPDGLYEIPHGKEAEFLATLPIQSLPYVGGKTQAALNHDGIVMISDAQKLGMEELVSRYGARGYWLFQAVSGRDDSPVVWWDLPPKSVGAETTFEKDQIDQQVIHDALEEVIAKACRRLNKHKMRSKTVSIKLRFSDFRTITRSHTLITHVTNIEVLTEALKALFTASYAFEEPLRLVGVSFENLTDSYWQPTLWNWEEDRQ